MPHAMQVGSRLNQRVSSAFDAVAPARVQEELLMARTPQEHADVLERQHESILLSRGGFKYFNKAVDGVFGRGFKNRVSHPRRDASVPKSAIEAVTTGIHFTLTAASAPVTIPAYRTFKMCFGSEFPFDRRHVVRRRAWSATGRAIAVLPGALCEGAALLGAGLKAAPIGVMRAAVKMGATPKSAHVFLPLKNNATMVMQEPLDNFPSDRLFITSDRWQFDAVELFECLLSRGDFVNPLSLEPFGAQDLVRLSKHPRCPPTIRRFLSSEITVSADTVRRLLVLSHLLRNDMEASIENPRSVLALGQFSDHYNALGDAERGIVRQFGIEALLERTRQGDNCIHNTGAVVPSMVRQLLRAGRGDDQAMRYLDDFGDHDDSDSEEEAMEVLAQRLHREFIEQGAEAVPAIAIRAHGDSDSDSDSDSDNEAMHTPVSAPARAPAAIEPGPEWPEDWHAMFDSEAEAAASEKSAELSDPREAQRRQLLNAVQARLQASAPPGTDGV